MQGVWHALNRQDWSLEVAPLAAALAEKASLFVHLCVLFAPAQETGASRLSFLDYFYYLSP